MSDVFYHQKHFLSFDEFASNIAAYRQKISTVECQDVLLFHQDSYQFTVWLFALVLEGKQVLLPPNRQLGTLEKLANYCDATAGDICLTDKVSIQHSDTISRKHHITLSSIDELFELFEGKVTFYTSGSTGNSKAIVKSCRHLKLEANTLIESFSSLLNHSHLVASTVSHQHIYGLLFKILMPLLAKKVIINTTFEYPEHLVNLLHELEVPLSINTVRKVAIISSPAHLKRLVLDNVLAPFSSNISAIFSSGGPLSRKISQMIFEQMSIAPLEVYGSTETGGIAWRQGQLLASTPWQLFSGITYHVSSDENRLVLNSPYIVQPNYVADDIVEAIDEQRFVLKGRTDRTIKIEEKRVNLNQIERYLIAHEWVEDVRILAIKRPLSGRDVLACAVLLTTSAREVLAQSGKLALNKQLTKHLQTDFEAVCLPKKWRYLTEFPINAQGKLTLENLENLFA